MLCKGILASFYYIYNIAFPDNLNRSQGIRWIVIAYIIHTINPSVLRLNVLFVVINNKAGKVHSLSSGKIAATPILKSVPSQFSRFFSLNYSLTARLQDNSRPESPTKVETKRKSQQFTVSGWLIMNGGESGREKRNL